MHCLLLLRYVDIRVAGHRTCHYLFSMGGWAGGRAECRRDLLGFRSIAPLSCVRRLVGTEDWLLPTTTQTGITQLGSCPRHIHFPFQVVTCSSLDFGPRRVFSVAGVQATRKGHTFECYFHRRCFRDDLPWLPAQLKLPVWYIAAGKPPLSLFSSHFVILVQSLVTVCGQTTDERHIKTLVNTSASC